MAIKANLKNGFEQRQWKIWTSAARGCTKIKKTMKTDDKHSFLAVYTEEDISASYISFENISEIYIDAKNRKVDIVTKGTDTISFHEVTLIKHVQSKQIHINFKQ